MIQVSESEFQTKLLPFVLIALFLSSQVNEETANRRPIMLSLPAKDDNGKESSKGLCGQS